MLPDSQLSFILAYKGRCDDYDFAGSTKNAFSIKVEGASELLVDGTTAQPDGGALSHSSMADDDLNADPLPYKKWSYVTVKITVCPEATNNHGAVDVTLSLVPNELTDDYGQKVTYGGFVQLLKVEFETFEKNETREIGGNRSPNWKAHTLNLDTKQEEETHYGDYKKCVAHIWSDQPLNLAKYLSDYESNQEIFENPEVLNWIVNEQLQTSSELNLETNTPNENQYERYNIEVVLKGSSEPIDQLIVTVVPPETLTNFDQWLMDNQDLGWLADLPALYSTVLLDTNLEALNPEPSNLTCSNWKDNAPFKMYFDMSANTRYHPAADHEIRSEETPDGHGHQACYNIAGVLIRLGVSAGTADRAYYGNTSEDDGHVVLDARPFVWAVQLDGNPADGINPFWFDYANIDSPIMHEGEFIGEYIKLRPPTWNGLAELIPGNCP